MHELEGVKVPATMATIVSHLTLDQDLRGDVDIRPGSLSHDLDSIRDR